MKTHRGEPRRHIPDLGKLTVPENLRAPPTEGDPARGDPQAPAAGLVRAGHELFYL
ncbi:hypothetical protein ACWDA3_27000 [Nonomuraea rubra]